MGLGRIAEQHGHRAAPAAAVRIDGHAVDGQRSATAERGAIDGDAHAVYRCHTIWERSTAEASGLGTDNHSWQVEGDRRDQLDLW